MPRKDFEVIVYCAGPRSRVSANVARALSEMGYSDVRRYVGGKEDWMKAGLPMAGEDRKRVA